MAGILGGTGAVIGSGIMTIIMGIVIQGLPIFQALLLFSIILLTLLLSGLRSVYSRVNPFVDSHDDGRQRRLKADARAAARRHGKKDVDWIGSRVFLETRGLYKTCPNLRACPLATAPCQAGIMTGHSTPGGVF